MDQAILEQHLKALERDGYTIVENAIEPELVRELRDEIRRIQPLTLKDVEEGGRTDGMQQLRTCGLLSMSAGFRSTPTHPNVLPIVEGVLGPDCLLSIITAVDLLPGLNGQPIHHDDILMPVPRPHAPIYCTTMWALTDFTADNGATRLIPGSHRSPESHPPVGQDGDGTIAAEMSAGSVLIFDGSLWHRAGDNRTDDERRLGLQTSYCPGFIRPVINWSLMFPPEKARHLPERLRALMGYSTYRSIGSLLVSGTHRDGANTLAPPESLLLG